VRHTIVEYHKAIKARLNRLEEGFHSRTADVSGS
jgi:hypothetical protein